MGCLNSGQGFNHWFGNIHLSGPCNRSCYFCIGQHMMALDGFNVLDTYPLKGLDEFAQHCRQRGVKHVNLTGTNTDPSLYRHQEQLAGWLHEADFQVGLRTNGARQVPLVYDHVSVSITSLDPRKYRETMGHGDPPDIAWWLRRWPLLKVNIVLCPETKFDVYDTVERLAARGVTRINLREPYGQPHVGDPYDDAEPVTHVYGMPIYLVMGCQVCYWDVHFCEVESVNLYASGRVSETYPITKGHDDEGVVIGQERWLKSGRVREQWVTQ